MIFPFQQGGMKNSQTIKIAACAMVLSAAITSGAFSTLGTTTFDTNISAAQSAEVNSISVEQAKEIALNHAGKTADQVHNPISCPRKTKLSETFSLQRVFYWQFLYLNYLTSLAASLAAFLASSFSSFRIALSSFSLSSIACF